MPDAYNRTGAGRGIANLRRLAYFAEVVEAGSFTAAAGRLGITKAVVSQQVARLERDFETTLLTRTTRSVRPTPEGQAFYERCARVLAEAQDAFDGLETDNREPTGMLRLTAPFDYGVAVIVPVIAEFQRRYPRCAVDLVVSDRQLDQRDNDIELAIRLGWLADSSLRARRIGSFRQIVVADPALAAAIAPTATPDDIAALPFVANGNLRDPLDWTFRDGTGRQRPVRFSGTLSISATLGVLEAVRNGSGVSILPDFAVAGDLATGALKALLPAWSLDDGGIHATMPATRFQPARVSAFVTLLSQWERQRTLEGACNAGAAQG